MSKRKGPKLICSTAFAGNDELDWDDLEALRESDITNAVSKVLGNWNGALIGLISLQLGNDPCTISEACFHLLGSMFNEEAKIIATDKLFPGSGVKMHLKNLDFELFKFTNSLTSSLVDSSELDVSYKFPGKNGKELTADEERNKGIFGFSLRVHAYPTQEDAVNVVLLAFPKPATILLAENPAASSPKFPGIELCKVGLVELKPDQASLLGDRSWGLPLLPLFLTENEFLANSPLPPTTAIRTVMSALLRSGVAPNCSPNWRYLEPRWSSIKENGIDALPPPTTPFVWPEPRPLDLQQGRHLAFFLVSVCYYSPPFISLPSRDIYFWQTK